ncbi:MAG: transcriptional regulator [Chitinispirillales bacterium]|jgi:hypothetical protein|nr:transcriptional regulator [Chitinispirillales bacterium]
MGISEKVKISPEITGQDDWITGEVIDIEKNPFNGIVISAKDAFGRIFFDKEKYFIPLEEA